MSVIEEFVSQEEKQMVKELVEQGYVMRDADNRPALDALRHEVVKLTCQHLGEDLPVDDGEYLDNIHKKVTVDKLNALRLHVYNSMNAYSWFRPTYYALGKSILESLVGNELAMQNKINFSIQLSHDDSSLIGIHVDSYTGETPFQVVQWIPLVDVSGTKSMFVLPPKKNREIAPTLKKLIEEGGTNKIYEECKEHLVWIEVPYGKVVVFSPNILHGNIVNIEPTSRWSMNCRFTEIFTPYTSSERKLGDFYQPITTKIISRIGMNYTIPEGYND